MQPISRALSLFRRERGLWSYAVKPLLWGVLAYIAVFALMAIVGNRVGAMVSGWFGASASVGASLGTIVGVAISVVLAGGIYLALVALIAGFGFDKLSMEVEEREFGRVVGQPLSFSAGIGDGISRAILAGVLGLVALCTAGTIIVPLLIASFLCLLDFTAPSLLRRGVSLGSQFSVARRLPGATRFALTAGVIMLVPVLNVLALPILVAAATILVAGNEKG